MNSELTKQSIKLSMIVAMCSINKGIGLNGTIPWRLPKDLKFFSRVTSFTRDPLKLNAMIMGRLTWNSIPKGLRPLPNRLNVVISSTMTHETSNTNENADLSNLLIFKSFDEAIEVLLRDYSDRIETIFAIGGTQIFRSAFKYPTGFLNRIYLTRVHDNIECDVFMEPENFLDDFKKLEVVEDEKNYNVEFNTLETEPSNKITYTFEVYEKV